jgi:uncharacterized RDD family membrane protein YckC
MNTPIKEYVSSSQNICLCSTISIVLIFLFMVSPVNKFLMTSFLGKLSILLLLAYTLYYNIQASNKLSNKLNIVLIDGSWTTLKTNLTCSYIFSFFLFVLLLSVIRCTFFKKIK